ncbi:uncharacterized protein LOC134278407 isoform X2 [Saccostrea cucullata]|uniref:uncharacterized protein LOC134278407 isoform X2 n=1 Tax=Saccostrea cuccullata TaxID=36930 RepID=UPI002ED643C2
MAEDYGEKRISGRPDFSFLIKCPICHDTLRNPKILSCFHHFCAECIEKHHTETQEGNQALCPLCRRPFVLDLSGANSLPTCPYAQQVLDEIEKRNLEEEERRKCVRLCTANMLCKENLQTIAVFNCPTCQLDLCENCEEAHSKFAKTHAMISLQKTEAEPDMIAKILSEKSPITCNVHSEFNLKFFCENCDLPICQECELDHDGHKIATLREIEEQTKNKREIIKTRKEELEKLKGDLNAFLIMLQTGEDKAQREIQEYYNGWIKKMEDHMQCMLSDLKERSSKTEEEIIGHLKALDNQSINAAKVLQNINKLIAIGNETCTLKTWNVLYKKIEKLEQDKDGDIYLPEKFAYRFSKPRQDFQIFGKIKQAKAYCDFHGMFKSGDELFSRECDSLHAHVSGSEENVSSFDGLYCPRRFTSSRVDQESLCSENFPENDSTERQNVEVEEGLYEDNEAAQTFLKDSCASLLDSKSVCTESFGGDQSTGLYCPRQSTSSRVDQKSLCSEYFPENDSTERPNVEMEEGLYEENDSAQTFLKDVECLTDSCASLLDRESVYTESFGGDQPTASAESNLKENKPPPPPPRNYDPKASAESNLKENKPLPPLPRNNNPKEYQHEISEEVGNGNTYSVSKKRKERTENVNDNSINPYLCLNNVPLKFEVSGGTMLPNGQILLTSYHEGALWLLKESGEIIKRVKAKYVWDAAAGVDFNGIEQVFVTFVRPNARKKSRVDLFSTEGECLGLFTKDVDHPLGVACSSKEVFVSDKNKMIKVFFLSNGCLKYTIKNTLFKNPWFIALKGETHLLVSDFDANCVFLINLDNPREIVKKFQNQMATNSDVSAFVPGKCLFLRKICFLSDQKGKKVGIITQSGRMRTFIKDVFPDIEFAPFLLLMNSKDNLIIVSKSGLITTLQLDFAALEDYTIL